MALTKDPERVKKTMWSLVHLNFYRLHLLYFIVTILITSVILFGSSTSSFHIGYTDALFLCTSAMCNVGLNPVNISSLNGFQHSILFVLMFMGDITIVTISVVYVRRYYFSKRMSQLVEESDAARRIAEDIEEQPEGSRSNGEAQRRQVTPPKGHSKSPGAKHEAERPEPRHRHREPLLHTHLTGYGSFSVPWPSDRMKKAFDWGSASPPSHEHHYLSFQLQLDRKGRFTSLDECQRDELGGVEYRALKVLSWLLPLYTLGWLAAVVIALTPYSMVAIPNEIRNAQYPPTNPTWWAVFASLSGYTNTGLNLLNSNMIRR